MYMKYSNLIWYHFQVSTMKIHNAEKVSSVGGDSVGTAGFHLVCASSRSRIDIRSLVVRAICNFLSIIVYAPYFINFQGECKYKNDTHEFASLNRVGGFNKITKTKLKSTINNVSNYYVANYQNIAEIETKNLFILSEQVFSSRLRH